MNLGIEINEFISRLTDTMSKLCFQCLTRSIGRTAEIPNKETVEVSDVIEGGAGVLNSITNMRKL